MHEMKVVSTIWPTVMMLLAWGDLQPAAGQNYCRFSQAHTMCQFQGIGPACGQPQSRGLSDSEILEVVDYHNRLRSRVASGSTGQPPAANMRELEWDSELATVAQRLADQCKFMHDCTDCRKVDRFQVGQNIYQSFTTSSEGKSNWVKAIDSWYNEISIFDSNSVSRYNFDHATGHYSQMMWAKTNKIGCGVTGYVSGRFNARLYVCNYGESGNIIRRPVYKIGQPCSECDSGSCSNDYPGLCTDGGSGSIVSSTTTTSSTSTTSSSGCSSFMCMINKPILMANEAAMGTVHTVGDMAMDTVHNVGGVAMDTVNTFGNVAMNTVEDVTNLGNNIVFRPVNTLMSTGLSLVTQPFAGFGRFTAGPLRTMTGGRGLSPPRGGGGSNGGGRGGIRFPGNFFFPRRLG